MTLTEFLLARIAEDEASAPYAISSLTEAGSALVRYSPARVLAECEAKRQIVEEHPIVRHVFLGMTAEEGCERCNWNRDYGWDEGGPCLTLRLIALPYAYHPDYRDEWKP